DGIRDFHVTGVQTCALPILDRAKEILTAAGAKDIVTCSPLPYAGWHLLGTARMGDDPRNSVVNGWGRSHDVKNLFIVDGSVFVSSEERRVGKAARVASAARH